MDAAQIGQVRRFNRLLTQRIGALEETYLDRGRPLAEARLLFEVSPEGADLRDLRARLGLDSGYLSRLLRSLEAQKLVRVRSGGHDGRRRRVSLTAKGRAEVAIYDRLSDDLAASMLSPLDARARERLVGAMAEIERLIRAAAVAVRVEAPSSAAARWCLEQYFQELSERFESGFEHAKALRVLDEDVTPPKGFFFVAWLDGEPAGCGGLRLRDGVVGEVKRMWVKPSARGQGVARKILRTIEAKAREADLTRLRLDTNRTLKEAQALYRSEGYREVARFNDEPYAHHWFEKRLCGQGTALGISS